MAYKNIKGTGKYKKQSKKKETTKNLIANNSINKHTKYARTHKDRLFRFIFNQKADLLSLYNAINESDYSNEDDLIIYTMEDFIYMGMKNDLSFLIDCNLTVFEHQSTYNPNMPLRGFLYMASALKKYISAQNLDLYSYKTLDIPVPRYYVFYNGTRNIPDEQILRLTDSMPANMKNKSSAEFLATMININANHSSKLMKRCPKLYEYAIFISRIRENMALSLPLTDALELAITDCIHDNILAEILRNHKAEVTDMILDEYDEKFHIANEKKLSYEEGIKFGALQAQKELQQEQLHSQILYLKLQGKSDHDIINELNITQQEIEDTITYFENK